MFDTDSSHIYIYKLTLIIPLFSWNSITRYYDHKIWLKINALDVQKHAEIQLKNTRTQYIQAAIYTWFSWYLYGYSILKSTMYKGLADIKCCISLFVIFIIVMPSLGELCGSNCICLGCFVFVTLYAYIFEPNQAQISEKMWKLSLSHTLAMPSIIYCTTDWISVLVVKLTD